MGSDAPRDRPRIVGGASISTHPVPCGRSVSAETWLAPIASTTSPAARPPARAAGSAGRRDRLSASGAGEARLLPAGHPAKARATGHVSVNPNVPPSSHAPNHPPRHNTSPPCSPPRLQGEVALVEKKISAPAGKNSRGAHIRA